MTPPSIWPRTHYSRSAECDFGKQPHSTACRLCVCVRVYVHVCARVYTCLAWICVPSHVTPAASLWEAAGPVTLLLDRGGRRCEEAARLGWTCVPRRQPGRVGEPAPSTAWDGGTNADGLSQRRRGERSPVRAGPQEGVIQGGSPLTSRAPSQESAGTGEMGDSGPWEQLLSVEPTGVTIPAMESRLRQQPAASSQQPRQGTVREMEHSGTKQGLLGDLGVIQSSLSWGGKAALWWAEERSRLGLDQHHAGSPCGAVGRGPGRGLLSRVGTRPGTPGALHSLWDIPIPSLPLRWPHSLLLSKR